MARKKTCRKLGCDAPPVGFAGLCARHDEEEDRRHKRFMEAADVLHTGVIDGEYIGAGPLRDELSKVRDWWSAACSAVNSQGEHPILKDETEFATHWCIGIAQEIIEAERDRRAGNEGDSDARRYVRQQFWNRFENLERGLMSNGVARPERRR